MLFQLIQVSLGKRKGLSRQLSEKEWKILYNQVLSQTVAGVCFAGIERLPKDQRPPIALLYDWIGRVEIMKQQNATLDNKTSEIWKKLKEAGLNSAIIKGQGIACEYGQLAALRQCGDIDVWVLGGYKAVCDYVQKTLPTKDIAYHRFHYPFYEDTEVELHHRPTLMRNLIDDRKLAKWYNSFGKESFVFNKEKGFAVPPASFNRIFILTHIYRHFLFEGIGLRQVMDLYFVLLNSEVNDKELDYLKEFRLLRFARAIMWILHTQFGLEEKKLMTCGMDEKEGRFVLNEIMITGNFGYSDTRYRYKYFFKLRRQMRHGAHLLMHYPSEVIWTPIWLIYHKIWKWNKKRSIC